MQLAIENAKRKVKTNTITGNLSEVYDADGNSAIVINGTEIPVTTIDYNFLLTSEWIADHQEALVSIEFLAKVKLLD